MKTLILATLLALLVSCGKSGKSQKNGDDSPLAGSELAREDVLEILAMDGASALKVSLRVQEISFNYKDYGNYLKNLDANFSITCGEKCEIKRKMK